MLLSGGIHGTAEGISEEHLLAMQDKKQALRVGVSQVSIANDVLENKGSIPSRSGTFVSDTASRSVLGPLSFIFSGNIAVGA
jgi:hypothetical protein